MLTDADNLLTSAQKAEVKAFVKEHMRAIIEQETV